MQGYGGEKGGPAAAERSPVATVAASAASASSMATPPPTEPLVFVRSGKGTTASGTVMISVAPSEAGGPERALVKQLSVWRRRYMVVLVSIITALLCADQNLLAPNVRPRAPDHPLCLPSSSNSGVAPCHACRRPQRQCAAPPRPAPPCCSCRKLPPFSALMSIKRTRCWAAG